MRWRLIDRVTAFDPWTSARGAKAVSLEEYSLLKPFDRRGFFPETLALETCVELARLLIEKSSGFATTSILREVAAFRIHKWMDRGARLDVAVDLAGRGEHSVAFTCRIEKDNVLIADGRIVVETFSLHHAAQPALVEGLWEELCGRS